MLRISSRKARFSHLRTPTRNFGKKFENDIGVKYFLKKVLLFSCINLSKKVLQFLKHIQKKPSHIKKDAT
jgi:hypothetical protein